MTIPFFSIVVPTRNRPRYVAEAIDSLLRQTFTDIEVIVSDNSSEADAIETRQQLAPLLADSRVRYVRPDEELNMTAHWEWALRHATGEYVGILTDRMALRHYALAEVAALIQRSATRSVCLASINVNERPHHLSLARPPREIVSRQILSREKLLEFSRGIIRKDCPRMLNSWTRKDVIQGLRDRFGSVCGSVSPDYFFCFRLLDEIDSFEAIDSRLLVVRGEHLSNGRAFKIGQPNEASAHFLERLRREQSEWLDLGPIRGEVWITPNGILREYVLVAKTSTSGNMPPMDIPSFGDQIIKYLKTLSVAGELSPETLQTLRAARLDPLSISEEIWAELESNVYQRPKPRPSKRWRNQLRIMLEPVSARLGLGKHLVGATLPDLLRIDAEYYAGQSTSLGK